MNKKKLNDYEHWEKGEYLRKLYAHINRFDLDQDEFSELVELSLKHLTDQRYGLSKNDIQNPIKRSIIRKLYFAFNIDCEKFLLEQNDEDTFFKSPLGREVKKKDYFTREYWEKIEAIRPPYNPTVDVISLPREITSNTQLIKAYDKLGGYIRKAKKSIVVHELLFKGSNSMPDKYKAYMKAQVKIHEAIEEVLEDKGKLLIEEFKYIRTLCLSPSESLHPKRNFPERLTALAIETAKETFKHLQWCLKNHPDKCEFYVANSSLYRSHCLIDEEILLTEDYTKHDKMVLPHILFVDNVAGKNILSTLKGNILDEDNREIEHRLDENSVINCFQKAISYLETQISNRERAIERMNREFGFMMPNEIREVIEREEVVLDLIKKQKASVFEKIKFLKLNVYSGK
ncbi:MAG: hypothetical protein R2824_24120 [Saprospiraceae bacterium]|nr:hypothetical protein [Lewinella sp.]